MQLNDEAEFYIVAMVFIEAFVSMTV